MRKSTVIEIIGKSQIDSLINALKEQRFHYGDMPFDIVVDKCKEWALSEIGVESVKPQIVTVPRFWRKGKTEYRCVCDASPKYSDRYCSWCGATLDWTKINDEAQKEHIHNTNHTVRVRARQSQINALKDKVVRDWT